MKFKMIKYTLTPKLLLLMWISQNSGEHLAYEELVVTGFQHNQLDIYYLTTLKFASLSDQFIFILSVA